MRHRKRTVKLGRTSSHLRCMWANMLKSLIIHGRVETSVAKAKHLRSHADKMVTLAKKGTLAARRRAVAKMMVRYNKLSTKEARAAKEGDTSAYNDDRRVINILFDDIAPRFANRQGGYTRLTRTSVQTGDASERCVLEFLAD